MQSSRPFTALATVASLLLAAGTASGQERQAARDRDRDGLLPRVLHLLPPAMAAELELTAEQQEQVKQMSTQFNEKRKATLVKTVMTVVRIVDGLEGKDGEAEPAPALAIAHEVTGALLDMRRTRAAFEKKLLAMMEPKQQMRFLAMKEEGPRDRARERRGDDAGVQRAAYSVPDLSRLDLTAEQKQKLTEMRQEYERRVSEVLTAEQRRQLEELQRTSGQRPRAEERKPKRSDDRDK